MTPTTMAMTIDRTVAPTPMRKEVRVPSLTIANRSRPVWGSTPKGCAALIPPNLPVGRPAGSRVVRVASMATRVVTMTTLPPNIAEGLRYSRCHTPPDPLGTASSLAGSAVLMTRSAERVVSLVRRSPEVGMPIWTPVCGVVTNTPGGIRREEHGHEKAGAASQRQQQRQHMHTFTTPSSLGAKA